LLTKKEIVMRRLILAASFVLPALSKFARIALKKLRTRAGLCGALALIASSAWAQTPQPSLSPLDARMRQVMANPKAAAAAVVAAKKVTFFCEVCHGADGNSTKGDVPNLAGQNPSYLLTQIDKFSRGERHYQFMEGLMKLLTEDDRINATVFYAAKTIKPAGNETSEIGKALYASRCAICHGAQARGNENTPRLAGQQTEYLKLSITRYRDHSGERIYEPMTAMTASLRNADIAALTAYLSSLQ
jgi:cytochrome c553